MLYDAEIMLGFIEEIEEYLPQIRQHLTKLAVSPKNKEALEEAYRLAHTIKGSAAMLELEAISNEGKFLEQTMLPVVEKKASYTPEMAQSLLSRVDVVAGLLASVRREMEGTGSAEVPPEMSPVMSLPPRPPVEALPPPPPPVTAWQPDSGRATGLPLDFTAEKGAPDFSDFMDFDGPDMPPIGFDQRAIPPPPPPPVFYTRQGLTPPDMVAPVFEKPVSGLPDWLTDEALDDDQTEMLPLPPPPPPPAYLYHLNDNKPAATGAFSPDFFADEPLPPVLGLPQMPPAEFRLAEPIMPPVPQPQPEILPPPPPVRAANQPHLENDLDLMDFLLEPGELESLGQLLFAQDEAVTRPSSPVEASVAQAEIHSGQDSVEALGYIESVDDMDFSEPTELEIEAAGPLEVAGFDGGLDEIFMTDPVDRNITLLQNEILSELPVHMAEFNTVAMPSEISVSDAELLMSLGSDTTSPDLSNLQGLDHGTQIADFGEQGRPLPASFPADHFENEQPAEIQAGSLGDFTAAADLLAEYDPENQLNFDYTPAEPDDPSVTPLLDDVPTVKAVYYPVPQFNEASLMAEVQDWPFELASLSVVPPVAGSAQTVEPVETPNFEFGSAEINFDDLNQTLAEGEEDYTAETLAAFNGLRGITSLETKAPAAEVDGAVAAMERDAASLPSEFSDDELAEAGFGADDSDMGAFFLAEGQADIDRLKELVSQFDGPETDRLASARNIGEISGTLRKAATMMDLEEVARQISVLENTASLVTSGEIGADAHGDKLFKQALEDLLALLQPYEAAAAKLFALPEAATASETVYPENEPEEEAEPAAQPVIERPLTRPAFGQPDQELDTELAEVFASEAEEHIQTLDTRLAHLEREPHNRELLREIRRTAHTLKGSAAMVGFQVISQTGHLMEDLLDQLYDGTRPVTPEVVELLFLTFNSIDAMVRDLAAAKPEQPALLEALRPRYTAMLGGTEVEPEAGDGDFNGGALIFTPKAATLAVPAKVTPGLAVRRVDEAEVAALEAAIESEATDLEKESETGKPALLPAIVRPAAQAPTQSATTGTAQPAGLDLELAVRVPIKRLDTMMNQIGELVINRTVLERRNQILTHTVSELMLSIKRLQRVTRELETRYEVELLKNEAVPVALAAGAGPTGQATLDYPVEPGSRYNTEQGSEFDTLEMDRYTEFHTLSREMTETVDDLAAATRELDLMKGDLENAILQQSRLTDDLQDKVVKVRLVPVSNLTPRLYRTVRSVTALQQKEVEFVVSGEQTQIDKTIFEELGDPLLHLVRNAIDHGIETPDEREAAGKPRSATLTFAARNEGSQVVIEVREDGRGIDLAKVRRIGIERGLIPAVSDPGEDELFELLFMPGFSTSDTITDISGRGVGLDVVRANIARLKGTIEVSSKAGAGTAFIIRLPSTLGITRALLVRIDGYTYAVPLNSIERTLRVEPALIAEQGQRRFYHLEEGPVPLLELNQLLQLHPHQRRAPDEDEASNRSQFSVRRERPLLLINGPDRAVVRVDSLVGQQEVVVKTLGTHLKNVPGVTGATILGTGEVILILNMYELVGAVTGRRNRFLSGSRLSQAAISPITSYAGNSGPTPPDMARKAPLIQVVDDSLSVRKVLSAALEKAGFRVKTSKDGQEALEMVQQVPPDLIVMDIEMPRMDGYELTSLLKSRESFRRIPVVMLTSRAGLKHRQKAEEVGADGFLIKPYREQELLQIVSALLVRVR